MPRLTAAQRRERDALVFDRFMAGASQREIAAVVQLSKRGVEQAVARAGAAATVEQLEARMAEAYPRAAAGDVVAAVQLRRAMGLLARLREEQEVAEAAAAAERAVRREGVVMVPPGTPSETVLALAKAKAAELAGEDQAVDVRLGGSEYNGREVRWRFSFAVA